MKIAYISNSRFPSERAHMIQIVHMCNALVELGHHVSLLVTDRKTAINEQPEEYYGAGLSFSVQYLNIPDIVGNISKIPRFLWVFSYMMQRYFFAVKVVGHIQNTKFDRIYGRDEWILLFVNLFIPLEKIIWESHEAKYNLPARILLRRGIRCIVISEGIQKFYLEKGIKESQLLVAHDGIDDSFFDNVESTDTARRRLNIPSDKPVVMYIGGLDEWKGVEIFMDVAKKIPNVRFVVIGGKIQEIERLEKKYPDVLFLGRRSYKELKNNQQAADILIIPNTANNRLSEEFTSPLKLFAYMTAKKPVIASRIPSITNVLTDEMAYFFEPDNSISLKETILQVLQDTHKHKKELIDRMYEKSTEYTWLKRADSILKFIV